MDTHTLPRPPVDVEQWLDFIIAAAAHRSQNEGKRKFGELLINRYFVNLRDEYKDDPIARAYFDNMLCAVASAIRGFSVVRDLFQTNWDALKADREREKARAERLDAFAPFKSDGYWKPALAVITAFGLLSPVLAAFKAFIGNAPCIVAGALSVTAIFCLFGMELLVDYLRNRRLARVEERFPAELYELWLNKSMNGYRMVARQFLLRAIKIREEFYPSLNTMNGQKVFGAYPIPHVEYGERDDTEPEGDMNELDSRLTAIVDQHFAFKPREKGE